MARRKRKSFGDYTDDTLEAGQMDVIRHSREKDCDAASSAMSALRRHADDVIAEEPSRAKAVNRLLRDSEKYVIKSCGALRGGESQGMSTGTKWAIGIAVAVGIGLVMFKRSGAAAAGQNKPGQI